MACFTAPARPPCEPLAALDAQTECINGHPLDPVQVLVGNYPNTCRESHIGWTCRACDATFYWPPTKPLCSVLMGFSSGPLTNLLGAVDVDLSVEQEGLERYRPSVRRRPWCCGTGTRRRHARRNLLRVAGPKRHQLQLAPRMPGQPAERLGACALHRYRARCRPTDRGQFSDLQPGFQPRSGDGRSRLGDRRILPSVLTSTSPGGGELDIAERTLGMSAQIPKETARLRRSTHIGAAVPPPTAAGA